MSMSKVMSNDRAAEKLAQVLLNYHSGKGWEKELADVLQAFAVKYYELSPEVYVGTDSDNSDDYPSTLWHKFFVKSLRNMLKELPLNVDKLKEALDALERKEEAAAKQEPSNNKRRRTEDNYDDRNVRTLEAKKLVRVRDVTKLRVHPTGLHPLRGHFQTHPDVNGGLDVLEFTFDDPARIVAKLGPAGDATVHDNDKDDF